jgi:type II secretory pathway component PulF
MHFGPLVPSIAKVLGGTVVMAAAVAGGWRAIAALGLGSRAADAAAVAVLVPAGIAVYGFTLWKLRIEGREELESLLSRMPVLGRLFRASL